MRLVDEVGQEDESLKIVEREEVKSTKRRSDKSNDNSNNLTRKVPTDGNTRTKVNSQSRKKEPRNELSKLLPGYIAPLKLDSSSLDPLRVGIAELRKRAERTDKSTAAFVVGSTATADHAKAMWSTPAVSAKTSVGFVPSTMVYSSFKTGTKRPADTSAGSRWFGMAPTPMTDELKTDLAVLRNRNYLDPKRFYKSTDPIKGKVLQLGTVIEGPTEYFSARLAKKQRRSNLAEEIMADPASADYAKRKFKASQQANTEKAKKWQRKGKKGKRGF